MNLIQTLTELKALKRNELSNFGLTLVSILLHTETPKLECVPYGMKTRVNLSFLEEGMIIKVKFPQVEGKPVYEFSSCKKGIRVECEGEKSFFIGKDFLPQEIVNFHNSNKSDVVYDFGMESRYN